MSGLFGDEDDGVEVGASQGSTAHSDIAADPPLLIVVRQLLARMPTPAFVSFIDAWRKLGQMASKTQPLPSGSGCTGSGMDWLVLKTITEVVCCVFQSVVVLFGFVW